MEYINTISYGGSENGEPWLVYKYPAERYQCHSILSVKQGEEAIIFISRKACKIFQPGTYKLNTLNLSLLNTYAGYSEYFSAEIFFVNMVSRLDMRWGTQSPFQLEDPKYGLILSIRSYGKYGLRICNSRMFVSELVSTFQNGIALDYTHIASYFSGLLTSKIKTIISRFMIQEQISFLEVTAYLDKLSEDCQDVISDEFDRFGVEIQNFYIESITAAKNDIAVLQKMKEDIALGHGFYQERRSYDVMEELARRSSGPGSFEDAGKGLSLMQNENRCSECGIKNAQNARFCSGCGKELLKKCSCCGRIFGTQHQYCSSCGTKL